MKSISLYKKAEHKRSIETIPIDIFFDNIKTGYWNKFVQPIRLIPVEDAKTKLEQKKLIPMVTLSGIFSERKDECLTEHSGLIGIDIDDVDDPDELKSLLCPDKYVLAAFTTVGGRGLCVVFRINPKKHREAFNGISEYLYNNYKIVIDPTSVNESRARFVSYDPTMYLANSAELFTYYPKAKPPKKIEKVIYVNDDFNFIMDQIISGQVNITQDSYHVWLRIGFSLVHKFGEGGRHFFHVISQYSSKYDPKTCDKQFDACMKHHASSKVITISTLYYYAKDAGLQVYSERTRKIAYTSVHGKKAGLNPEQIAESLRKYEDIYDATTPLKGESILELINTIINNGIVIQDDTIIDQLEMWIRQNYSLQRNEITMYIENNTKVMKLTDLNSIYIRAKKIFQSELTFDLVDRLINSDFVTTYNPLIQFFNDHGATEIISKLEYESPIELACGSINLDFVKRFPVITQCLSCINASNEGGSIKIDTSLSVNPFVLYFGVKWLVGAISAAYGQHTPLMFVLCGEKQNTGKTEFFRRLLPTELKKYYAESKLDREKDDEILMTQKWFIMDDEMGGKSKREETRLKELTSKQIFSLREPYGRHNVDLLRLAVLCGTSNIKELLNDPTGNRRIIPVHVVSINNKLYNSIDKVSLIMEAFKLYHMNFRWELNSVDIEYLGLDKQMFEVINSESELIMKYFEPGSNELTATDIKVYMEQYTRQKLSLDKIGKELQRLKFVQRHIKYGSTTKRVYLVSYLIESPVSSGYVTGNGIASRHNLTGNIADILGPDTGLIEPNLDAQNEPENEVKNDLHFVPIHKPDNLPF